MSGGYGSQAAKIPILHPFRSGFPAQRYVGKRDKHAFITDFDGIGESERPCDLGAREERTKSESEHYSDGHSHINYSLRVA